MDEEILIGWWQDWIDKQKADRFVFNSDKRLVADVVKGVLENEEKKGFRFCPCRLPTGDEVKNLGLICPCNFKVQDTWKDRGECWCSLFVKSEKEVK
jgi:ferredoxin-thioredoxin reductase catalytic subunit